MKIKTLCILMAACLVLSLSGCSYEKLLDELMGKVDLSVEAEEKGTEDDLRDKILTQAEGNIIWMKYDDFDGNGTKEAFAFVGNVTASYYEGKLWYANEDYTAELTDSGKWTTPVIISEGGGMFLFVNDFQTDITYVYGMDEGKVYESAVSGMFTNLKSAGGSDFTAEFTSYDYYEADDQAEKEEPTTKLYWFYIKDGEFHEYGADATLKRADLRKYPTGGAVMDEIYKTGLTSQLLEKYYSGADEETLKTIADDAGYFKNIMLRENGIINLNFYGAYEDCFYITFRINGSDLDIIDCGRGFYKAAAVEGIATYPEVKK